MSLILVMFTSCSDSNFERSNISLKENKWDGIDSNSNGFDYWIRKNEGKLYGFWQTEIWDWILERDNNNDRNNVQLFS